MALARDALWESGHDESVEVNQRALIDKVLARYSGEFTVFRELLQNSDDAGAKAVEIRFETKEYLNRKSEDVQSITSSGRPKSLDEKAALVHQWSFRNNGMIFRDEDWNRLKKIAEGNPDEEKIGAFGVGFYSLFSVTEEPFVTSGGQWMGFYWKDKKDQLFARRGKIPSAEDDPWTTFEMSLREPVAIPRAFDLTRFLASSITFMAHLCEINVYLDDQRISRLTKDPGLPKSIGIPKGLKCNSPRNLMQVKEMHTTPLSIKAELMRWVYMAGSEKPVSKTLVKAAAAATAGPSGFFSSLFSTLSGTSAPQRPLTPSPAANPTEEVDPTTITESSVVLLIFTAGIAVRLDQKLRSELNRATKKNPPTTMRLELIYTGKDEYDASRKEDDRQPASTGSVFQGLRADIEGAGAAKVFIGHSTGQTTGLAGHLAARFIPTVERESIDLMDRTVAVWNEELLHIGGFVARAAYELEMDNIRQLWTAAAESARGDGGTALPDEELQTWLRGRAIHALKFFTFRPSTPSSLVSAKLEAAFFSCAANHPFPIISTRGVRSAADVRRPDPVFMEFLKELPVLPGEVTTGAEMIVGALRTRGMIRDIQFVDVLQELRARPLTEAEMVMCLKWWTGMQGQVDAQKYATIRSELLNAALLFIGETQSKGGKVIPMSSIQTFLNTRAMPGAIVPTDGPLPPHLLPVGISKQLDTRQLSSAFAWRELSILEWLQPISDPAASGLDVEHDFTKSAQWAERVLQVISRAWQHLSKDVQEQIVALVRDKSCVPTTAGLKTPQEAYFQSAHVFRDLPIVHMPSDAPVKGPLEKVLQALGVRKHVDLQIVFNRMIKTGDWTIAELIKYLVAVQSTLSPLETDRLRMTAAFLKEDESGNSKDNKATRYKASDLYEPLDILRKLGLPIIAWGEQPRWRPNSEEAKFLYGLGLRRFPPLPVVIELCTSQDQDIRSTALQYLLSNLATRYTDYDPGTFQNTAYVPTIKNGGRCLAKPFEVYTSSSWAQLGFLVVDPTLPSDAVAKLKIPEHPPTTALVNLLERSPPNTIPAAREWFSVLASRVTVFTPAQLKKLSTLPFVPAGEVKGGNTRMLPPSQCYFSGTSNVQFHSKLFVFVDFGNQANQFLSACGTKHEPSVEEIAKILLEDPRKFYELADGRDNYLAELRNIAVNNRLISTTTITRLKRAPVLLGSRRVKKDKSAQKASPALDSHGDLDEDDWDLEYDLLSPEQVVIADDTHAYQSFGTSIFTAPQEDLLEAFYLQLGSKLLSSVVREEYRTSAEVRGSRKATEIRSLILERLPLFLHEHTHSRPRVSYTWLNNEKNFVVRTFGKLSVIKTLQFGSIRATRSQDTSAVAKRDGRGPIELWLAGNDQVDMYEVATSMCRLIFESAKVNDALLFMTILSTDLRALRRRGYNVDRILRQQKAQRDAQEEANKEKAKSTALVSRATPEPPSGPVAPTPPLPSLPAAQTSPSGITESPQNTAMDALKRVSGPSTMFRQSLDDWRKRMFHSGDDASRSSNNESVPPTRTAVDPHSAGNKETHPQPDETGLAPPPMPPPRTLSPGRLSDMGRQDSHQGVTPRRNIAANIAMAVDACKQENSQQVRARENMQMVKETLNEGYCDGSGEAIDLIFIGDMGGVKVYVSRDVPDAKSLMSTKSETIARFIYVIRPLCEVYRLSASSIHIYYDSEGPRIAFNRNASLFLNLRYFEAWHDPAVQTGELTDAYISWYFTLAHEIAHNLVGPHNSEHEFYLSALSEAYLPSLVMLLTSTK